MPEALISLTVASILLLGSPGPAPLALAATGAVFGFRRGMPFLVGILAGLAVAVTLGSVGMMALFERFPASRLAMQIAGSLYIAYVAWKIATAPVLAHNSTEFKSVPGLRDGLILNLLNPKAYAAFVALFSQFMLPLPGNLTSTLATALVIFCVVIVVDVAWLALGGLLRPVFETPRLARAVRVVAALLMLLAVAVAFRL